MSGEKPGTAGDGQQADGVRQLLALKLDGHNDAGASDVRDYLRRLLAKVWLDEEDFDGKRPFGNSGWRRDVYGPMLAAGLVGADEGPDGLVCAAIDAMCRGDADPAAIAQLRQSLEDQVAENARYAALLRQLIEETPFELRSDAHEALLAELGARYPAAGAK